MEPIYIEVFPLDSSKMTNVLLELDSLDPVEQTSFDGERAAQLIIETCIASIKRFLECVNRLHRAGMIKKLSIKFGSKSIEVEHFLPEDLKNIEQFISRINEQDPSS